MLCMLLFGFAPLIAPDESVTSAKPSPDSPDTSKLQSSLTDLVLPPVTGSYNGVEYAVPRGGNDFDIGDSQSVAWAQKRLAEHGFSPGQVDGQFGDATRESLKRFQKSLGVHDTNDTIIWLKRSFDEAQQRREQVSSSRSHAVVKRLQH